MAIAGRIIVVGWDGFRPDLIDPGLTPNLCRLIARGALYRRATSVFPSETRPNNATIGTGCQPGRHGITANHLRVPGLDLGAFLDTGRPDHLLALGDHQGRIVTVETLGEALARQGRRLAVVGSGSPGQTLLQNPHGGGVVLNRAVRIPATLELDLTRRLGPQPERDAGGSWGAVDAYLQRAALEYLVPEQDPAVLVLWSSEPDISQHSHGLGSRQAVAAIRLNDERLGELLAWLEREGRADSTTLIFMSDHGHSTVRGRIDIGAELAAAHPAWRGEVTTVGPGLRLGARAREGMGEIAAWLRAQPWCGPLFARDDVWHAALAGVAPSSSLWDGYPGASTPDLLFSLAWDDEPNSAGVPGRADSLGRSMATDHGSLSPRDMGSVLILAGAGVRHGVEIEVPGGPVDIAPTAAHVLGLEAPRDAQGRVLGEAFDGGIEPAMTVEPILEGPWGTLVRRRVDRSSYLAVEAT